MSKCIFDHVSGIVNAPFSEKPKNRRFSHKNPKMFDFRFNTPTSFPESGSKKRFHASGVRAIDSPHKIAPKGYLLKKIFDIFTSAFLFLLSAPPRRSSSKILFGNQVVIKNRIFEKIF